MDVLKVIFLYFEFFGWGLLLRRCTGLPLFLSPPLIASIIILTLYFFGFVLPLKHIAIVLHVIGLLSFVYFAGSNFKRNTLNKSLELINKAHVIYFVGGLFILLIFFLLDRKGEFISWDEFSHWGSVIRTLYEADSYTIIPNPLYCQDYPPGTALFSYYVLIFLGYTEGHAFFSFSLLLLCYITPLVIYASWANILLGVFVSIVLLYLSFALGNGWASVLIDHVLSFGLASCVVFYYLSNRQFSHLIFMPFMLSALVLLKHVGTNLALFTAVVCFIDLIILRVFYQSAPEAPAKKVFVSFKTTLWILALFALPILTSLTWKYFVHYYDLIETWGNLSLSTFFKKSLSCCSSQREIEVAGKFFATLFDLGTPLAQSTSIAEFGKDALERVSLFHLVFYSPEYTVAKVIITLGVLGSVGACSFSTWLQRTRFILLNLELMCCTILYSGSLLLAYLYGFSDYEAKILTSFQRYHNLFLLAWCIILLYVFVELYRDLVSRIHRRILVAIILCFSLWSLYSITPTVKQFLRQGAWTASAQRLEVRKVLEPLKSLVPPNSRLYIAWYGSNGWEFWMSKYEFLPRMTNLFCFSLGPKLNKDDMYTCNFDPSLIKNYDYLLIGKGLQILKKNYPSYFESVPDTVDEGMLKIERNTNAITLKYLQP